MFLKTPGFLSHKPEKNIMWKTSCKEITFVEQWSDFYVVIVFFCLSEILNLNVVFFRRQGISPPHWSNKKVGHLQQSVSLENFLHQVEVTPPKEEVKKEVVNEDREFPNKFANQSYPIMAAQPTP